jgi:uncharacterized protein with LGFP repeats
VPSRRAINTGQRLGARQPTGDVVKKQQGRLGNVLVCAALGLVALATGIVLLVPIASASPGGDADDAITATWKRSGADNSDLGAKQGDVYPVGEGFAQDFADGKMFFTPASGARAMSGAILDKYEALGGPAGSDLGFPTIDEVPGLAGPASRVSTFSASDKPVIFWTPDHGAFVVRGAINTAWDKLGSSSGLLGVPVSDETYDGEVVTQAFSAGRVSWNRQTKAFTTVPPELGQQLTAVQVPIDPTAAINMAWRAAGGASGPLGASRGGQYPVGGDGLVQNFAGGKVFFNPATGANAVDSDILAKYESLGGPAGSALGFPTANEADGGIKPASRVSTFAATDKAVIFWTPDHGAFVVRGAMKAAWDKLGGSTGKLGAPVGDQTVDSDVVAQKFTGGQIAWDEGKNTFSTQPANLASSLSGLQLPGHKMPAGSVLADSALTRGAHRAFAWHWRWLLVVGILALLLIGVAVLVTLRWRRRRVSARRDAGPYEPGRDVDLGYDAVTDSVPHLSEEADSDLASARLSDGYREPSLSPRTVRLPSQLGSGWMRPVRSDLVDESLAQEIGGVAELSDVSDGADEDPDSVDTAPTRIPTQAEVISERPQVPMRSGRHAAVDTADDETEFVALQLRAPGELAIHLPLDDPYQVPEGYPVKANASFGLYYMPDSVLYEDTLAEIWFASEDIARANGFVKAG